MNKIQLTPAERIHLLRFRSGLTQAEFAAKLGVPIRSMMSWERGTRVPPSPPDDESLVPTEGELARLLRLRAGLSLKEAGDLINVSHVTVISSERGRSKLAGSLIRALEKYLTTKELAHGEAHAA